MSVKRLFDDFDSDSNSVIVDEDSGHCMSTHIFCGESTTVKKGSFLAPDSDAVHDEDVTLIKKIPRKPRRAEFIPHSPEPGTDADVEDNYHDYPILR